MATVLGIDEAGRGPVVGPLVIAGVKMKDSEEAKLKVMGVKDSKILSKKQRDALFVQVTEHALSYKIIIIPPAEIDKAVVKNALNWLEADKSIEIINELKPDKVIVDSPSPNLSQYKGYIQKKVSAEVIAEHKADANYPVVSAASILAKVTRDREIEKISESLGIDFGSGYPSDPRTQKFIKDNHDKYPDIFRKSWSTFGTASEAKKQKHLGDF